MTEESRGSRPRGLLVMASACLSRSTDACTEPSSVWHTACMTSTSGVTATCFRMLMAILTYAGWHWEKPVTMWPTATRSIRPGYTHL
eukprot:CAMPEP_0202874812 /NCGR_PEP_ID=MMETSP1391-20130828/26078_1 /ASSEMBLY_ACC=CAM_ASM_000867 /TAXON_ID=1034604 /ORGANISM="Chlamydomonas leiostraca, Strain SAG 11-49" /LENGTH=86 /DNA_ID=CAMNT_0049556343 /DNA_START=34 /DNA_END=294 /DNA_ORIENTATION=+